MKNYYYQQILKPLEEGNINEFRKIKNIMLNEVNGGAQLRIIPVNTDLNKEKILSTQEEVDSWFRHYGF